VVEWKQNGKMKLFNLFIDESGQSNPASSSNVYILSGCMVENFQRDNLKNKADQIKFKYWNQTNIVLHSREIWRKEDSFAILEDSKIQKSFEKDLFNFLNSVKFQLFFVLVDLSKAKKNNWNENKVYRETSQIMVKNFILSLLASKNCRGRIVIESATSKKDFYFHKAASFYLSAGISEVKADFRQVQDVLTEISFVTKKNYDIEEQIADLVAFGAKLKFLKQNKENLLNYDQKIIKVVENKLFSMHPNTGKKKRKFHSRINSFTILP